MIEQQCKRRLVSLSLTLSCRGIIQDTICEIYFHFLCREGTGWSIVKTERGGNIYIYIDKLKLKYDQFFEFRVWQSFFFFFLLFRNPLIMKQCWIAYGFYRGDKICRVTFTSEITGKFAILSRLIFFFDAKDSSRIWYLTSQCRRWLNFMLLLSALKINGDIRIVGIFCRDFLPYLQKRVIKFDGSINFGKKKERKKITFEISLIHERKYVRNARWSKRNYFD